MRNALPISFSDAAHLTWLAERRADASEGRRIEIRTAMIPITTSSSTSVNACRDEARRTEARHKGPDERERVDTLSVDIYSSPRVRCSNESWPRNRLRPTIFPNRHTASGHGDVVQATSAA